MKKIAFLSLLLTSFLFSCNKDEGPEQVLRSFIAMRFEGATIKELVKKTTGPLETDLRSLDSSESDRKKFEQSSQLKKKALKILSRECEKETCKISYIISYEKTAGNSPYNAQIRNIANLELVEGEWRISSVSGLKSYFESKEDIEVESN